VSDPYSAASATTWGSFSTDKLGLDLGQAGLADSDDPETSPT
jgi:hypothetical protein